MLFAYLQLLRQPGGVSKDIFEESRQLSLMRFDWHDKSEPASICQLLAGSMQTHADRDVLIALYNVAEFFDAAAIGAVLAELVPEKCRAMWSSKQHQARSHAPPLQSPRSSYGENPAPRRLPSLPIQSRTPRHAIRTAGVI